MSLYEQNFFPEYKPLVFNTHLPKAAEVLRGRYDANMEAKSILDRAMGSVRTLNPIEQAKINQAKDEIEQKIAGRVDFENMGKIITDSTTRFLTDHRVLDAMDSYAVRQKEREMEDTLRVQGKTPLDFNAPVLLDKDGKAVIDPITNAPVRRHKTEDWDSETKGIYRMAVEEKLPWDVKAAQLIQGIQSDTNMMQKALMSGVDPGQVQYWLMQTSGVSKDKKDNIAKFLVDEFKSSSEGNQMFRDLTQLNVNPATGTVYTAQEAEDRMLNFLKDIGQKQVNVNYQYNQAAMPKSSGSGEEYRPEAALPRRTNIPNMFEEKLADTNVDEFIKKRLEPGFSVIEFFQGKGTRKVAELQKAYEAGNLRSVITPETHSNELLEFIYNNKDYRASFPKEAKEDEASYLKRLSGIFKDIHQPTYIALNDQFAARDLVSSVSMVGKNVFYDKNGTATDGLLGAIWDADSGSSGINFRDFSEGDVQKAFKDALAIDSKNPADIVHITTGPNAGKWEVTFTNENFFGDSRYRTVVEPVPNMGAYYAGMAELNRVAQSLRPGATSKVNVAGNVVVMRLVPMTEGRKSSLVPIVAYKDMYGRTVEAPLDQAEADLNSMMVQFYSNMDNKLGMSYRATERVREKKGYQ
jgi:hypothetical protein